MRPELSVLVPTKGCEPYLPDLLQSLAHQLGVASLPPLEILLVDAPPYANASVAHLASLLGGTTLRYIRQDRGRKGAALNLGVSQARADLLLFLDADVLLPTTALASALEMYHGSDRWDILSALRRHEVMGLDVFAEPIVRWWRFPGPWFCLMERRTLARLGGWSDDYVEDADLWIRTRRWGMRVGYIPERVLLRRPTRSQLSKSWRTAAMILRTGGVFL